MNQYTISPNFAKAKATNATDNGFPSKVPTVTEPSGDGVLTVLDSAVQRTHNNLLLIPYGTGADNATFSMRVIGWRKINTLWVPVPLLEVACTLSTAVGVAGAAVVNTERFVDTITLAAGFNSNVAVEVVSPTGNILGHVLLDLKGFQKIEVTFTTGGSATDCNALHAAL